MNQCATTAESQSQCRVLDCGGSCVARGFCSKHRQQFRHGALDAEGNLLRSVRVRGPPQTGTCKVKDCPADKNARRLTPRRRARSRTSSSGKAEASAARCSAASFSIDLNNGVRAMAPAPDTCDSFPPACPADQIGVVSRLSIFDSWLR